MRLMKRGELSPLLEIDGFENRIRQLLGRGFWPEEGEVLGFRPAVELVETEEEYSLTAELPGVSPEDVELTVEEGVLTLKGEKKAEREEKNPRYVTFERAYGAFERALALPRSVNTDAIQAEFKDGVMIVHLPKSQEAKGRRIEIQR